MHEKYLTCAERSKTLSQPDQCHDKSNVHRFWPNAKSHDVRSPAGAFGILFIRFAAWWMWRSEIVSFVSFGVVVVASRPTSKQYGDYWSRRVPLKQFNLLVWIDVTDYGVNI